MAEAQHVLIRVDCLLRETMLGFGASHSMSSPTALNVRFSLSILLLAPIIMVWFWTPPKVGTIPTASGHLPLLGNSISYGIDPIAFLKSKRAEHGDVFLVNLAVIRIVFLLGPEATNRFFKGTEQQGISFVSVWEYIFGRRIHECKFSDRRRTSC